MTLAEGRTRLRFPSGILRWIFGFFLLTGAAVIVFPGIDLWVSSFFFDPQRSFYLKETWYCVIIYRFVEVFAGCVALGLPLILIFTLARGKPAFSVHRKEIFYLIVVLVAGPGLLVNTALKDHWGRARPDQIEQFGGQRRFTPAWEISTECDKNCAFVSGHASVGFYLFAFAFISPRYRKKWAVLAATCGMVIGWVRIMQGSHFLSDVIFSGWVVFMTSWLSALVLLKGPDQNSPGQRRQEDWHSSDPDAA